MTLPRRPPSPTAPTERGSARAANQIASELRKKGHGIFPVVFLNEQHLFEFSVSEGSLLDPLERLKSNCAFQ